METKIELRDPADLRLHKLQKHVPDPDKESPQWDAFVDALANAGVEGIPPLFITADGHIMDGGWRWRAARQLQWPQIACIVRPETEAGLLIINSLVQRKHYTKSAQAYVAYPLMQNAHEEAHAKQLERLRSGNKGTILHAVQDGRKVDDLAESIGISRRLFCAAAEVHEIFAKDSDYRDLMEPRILAMAVGGEHESTRPVGLGAVIAGWEGRARTKDEPREKTKKLVRVEAGFLSVRRWSPYWEDLEPQEKTMATKIVREAVTAMPAELRQVIGKELKRIEQEEREAGGGRGE